MNELSLDYLTVTLELNFDRQEITMVPFEAGYTSHIIHHVQPR